MKVGTLYAELGIDRTQLRAGLQALKRESREATQSVERDANRAGDRIPKTLGEAFKQSGGHADAFNNKLSLLNKSIGGGVEKTGLFSRTMGYIKWPALIAGAQAGAGAIGALAAAAVQAVSAAAPLVGLMPAIGAGMLAARQGMVVAKLASVGVSDALGEISAEGKVTAETMQKLAPAARPFVAEMQRLSPEMDRMRDIAAAGLFPGVTDAVRTLSPLMARLRPIVRGTAEVMGDLAREGAAMVSGWGRDISTVGRSNERILHNLGIAGLGLADAFRHVLVEVQPLARWLSRVAVNAADTFREFIEGARTSGELAEFFGRTRDVATQLGHAFMNIGTTLANVARAAEPFGREMFASLERVTAGWAQFSGSVRGQNVLTAFFRDAQPAIKEVGLLLKDVVGFFFDMARQQTLGPLIKQIRTEFLPVLKQVGLSASGELLPALVELATQVARLFRTFGTETGVLVTFVKLMGGFLRVVQDLVGENKGLQNTVVTIGALAGASQALGVGQMIQFAASIRQVTLMQKLLNTQLVATEGAAIAGAGGIGRLGLALRGVGWVGAIAGFVLLGQKIDETLDKIRRSGGFGEVLESGLKGAARVLPGIGALVDAFGDSADKAGGRSNAFADAVRKAGAAGDLFTEKIGRAGAGVKDFAGMTISEFQQWRRGTIGNFNLVEGALGDLSEKHKLTAEVILREMRRALRAQSEFGDNWRRVVRRGGEDAEGFLRQLQEQYGARFPQLLEALAGANRRQFNEIIDKWQQGQRSARRLSGVVGNEFDQISDNIRNARGEVTGLDQEIQDLTKRFKGIARAANIKLHVEPLPRGAGEGIGLGSHPGGTPGAMMNWAIGKYDSGLTPTSGYRPGAITASGNKSLHSIPPPNNAWDFAGPAGSMLAAAQGIAGRFGSGIRELIHTPLGFGIKNGARVPLSFWGATINAMHRGHVHVARHGFHGEVTRPTLILAGEAGRERVDVTPGGGGMKGLRIAGTLRTPFGPAEIEATVVDVLTNEHDLMEKVVSDGLNRGVARRRH